MQFYFGPALLLKLQKYYEQRMALAISKGFDQQSAAYNWLYVELECRVSVLRKVLTMIDVLPEFMCRQTEEQIFSFAIGQTSSWFSNESLGEQPRDENGNCLYYQDSNPYWADYRTVFDSFTREYDYTRLAIFYADIVEYLVMSVRLYFYVREHQFKPIDRGKYDELVGIKAALSA